MVVWWYQQIKIDVESVWNRFLGYSSRNGQNKRPDKEKIQGFGEEVEWGSGLCVW